ncbi:putative zn cluster transcription factor rds2 [Phaeomoniella chlamydospora]|uniref:Putative zn cluster transcription factor rds2 n=1 Tax=Phaeomoniella chlamydospora TaxID=158046 RepID=A0A0G2EGZ9_PHACM|nr:putative zn cluster transcription factor rds2 [Phaeomoniella chlamydospora]
MGLRPTTDISDSASLPQNSNGSVNQNQSLEGTTQNSLGRYNDWSGGTGKQFQDIHTFHPSYMFNAPETTNEYNLLNDFLSTSLLDDAVGNMYGGDDLSGFYSDPSLINSMGMSLGNAGGLPFQPDQTGGSSSAAARGVELSRPPSTAPNERSDKARETYYMTAADPSGTDPPEERMNKLLKAKYDAGLLKPFNYVKGYARLQQYMEKHMRPASKQKILKQLDKFRPMFRERMQSLTDIELVLVEMWFERSLMEYDRIFANFSSKLLETLENDRDSGNALTLECARQIDLFPQASPTLSLPFQTKFDRQGTALWNACRNLRSVENEEADQLRCHGRVFALCMIEFTQPPEKRKDASSTRIFRVALRTAKHCLIHKELDLAARALEMASIHQKIMVSNEPKLSDESRTALPVLSSTLSIYRITLAWRKSRIDLAEQHFQGLDMRLPKQNPHITEALLDLFLEMGKQLLEDRKDRDLAVVWLRRGYELLEIINMEDTTSDMPDLRLGVLHTYVRALMLDQSQPSAEVNRIVNILEKDYGSKLAVQLLSLERLSREKGVDAQRYYEGGTMACGLMYQIHQLNKSNATLALNALGWVLKYRLSKSGLNGLVEKAIVTLIWILSLSEPSKETFDGTASVLTATSETWKKSLSTEATGGCLIASKLLLDRIPKERKETPLTRYLAFKLAIMSKDNDSAMAIFESFCASTMDSQYLTACVSETLQAGERQQASCVLLRLLVRYNYKPPLEINTLALLRCTLRLLIPGTESEGLLSDSTPDVFCKLFEASISQLQQDSQRPQSAKAPSKEQNLKEMEWFSKYCYNVIVKYCTAWDTGSIQKLCKVYDCIRVMYAKLEDEYDCSNSKGSTSVILNVFGFNCDYIMTILHLHHYAQANAHLEAIHERFTSSNNGFDLSKYHSMLCLDFERAIWKHEWNHLSFLIEQASNFEAPYHVYATFVDCVLASMEPPSLQPSIPSMDKEYRSPMAINLTSDLLCKITSILRNMSDYNINQASQWIRCIFQHILDEQPPQQLPNSNIDDNMETSFNLLDAITTRAILLARESLTSYIEAIQLPSPNRLFQQIKPHNHQYPSTTVVMQERNTNMTMTSPLPSSHLYPSIELEFLSTTLFNHAVDMYVMNQDVAGKQYARRAVEIADIMTEILDNESRSISETKNDKASKHEHTIHDKAQVIPNTNNPGEKKQNSSHNSNNNNNHLSKILKERARMMGWEF